MNSKLALVTILVIGFSITGFGQKLRFRKFKNSSFDPKKVRYERNNLNSQFDNTWSVGIVGGINYTLPISGNISSNGKILFTNRFDKKTSLPKVWDILFLVNLQYNLNKHFSILNEIRTPQLNLLNLHTQDIASNNYLQNNLWTRYSFGEHK